MLNDLQTAYYDLFSRLIGLLTISIWELTLFYVVGFILTIKVGL